MSYYEPQSWQLPMRQGGWPEEESVPPPSRSGASSAVQREDIGAFHTQVEEVDRAIDNLAKSGKLFTPPSRRDSMPMIGNSGQFPSDFAPRGPSQRHHSIDYDQMRPQSGSGNLQNFYASQRHQPRPNEAEQVMQAKRRMAAQRERELRNYHQEQQYNRSVVADVSTQGKSDRAISPNTMNEEERRELIARQHRALYGNESSPYYEGGGFGDDGHTPRPSNPASATASSVGGRGPSPRAFDPFAMGQSQTQSHSVEAGGQLNPNEQSKAPGPKGPSPKPQQQRSRADSTSSPASNPQSQNFTLFESAAQQSSRTSTSSPGGSPPRQAKTSAPGVAPIGTRPAPSSAANAALNKRSTTPSSASPLGYGYAPSDNLNAASSGNERSTSAASNPSTSAKDANVGAWGTGSGVWGNNNKPLGVQASVWG